MPTEETCTHGETPNTCVECTTVAALADPVARRAYLENRDARVRADAREGQFMTDRRPCRNCGVEEARHFGTRGTERRTALHATGRVVPTVDHVVAAHQNVVSGLTILMRCQAREDGRDGYASRRVAYEPGLNGHVLIRLPGARASAPDGESWEGFLVCPLRPTRARASSAVSRECPSSMAEWRNGAQAVCGRVRACRKRRRTSARSDARRQKGDDGDGVRRGSQWEDVRGGR